VSDIFGTEPPEPERLTDAQEENADQGLKEPVLAEQKEIAAWEVEWAAAVTREKKYLRMARRAVQIYEAEDSDTKFNILYSNTETLSPAVYNALPRPVVSLKNRANRNPVASAAALLVERLLTALMDPGDREYPDLNTLTKKAVNSAIVAGRGILRFKYDAKETFSLGEALPGRTMDQWVCAQYIRYDRFKHGYGATWDEVEWLGYDWYFTKQKMAEQFPGFEDLVVYAAPGQDDAETEEGGKGSARDEEGMGGLKLCHVKEIWDKNQRRVVFYTPSFPDRYLKQEDDPLELGGFYSAPQPLQYFYGISSLTPKPLYQFYAEQAMELQVLSARIMALTRVIKIRGGYDKNVSGLEKMLEAAENELVAVDGLLQASSSGQGAKLDQVIYLVPVEKHVATLQILTQQREAVKQVIYEITGISDILRGSSVASETATAQNIKNNWGTLRLKRFQTITSDYLKECLRILAEIALERMPEERIYAIADVQLPTQEELQASLAAVAQQAQQSGQPPPPEADVSKVPTKEAVMAVLKDDFLRAYTIDIETNSTVDAEATEDKQNITEFMNAFGQFMSAMAPLISEGSMPFEAAQAMLVAITRRFHMGPEVEGYLLQMKAPEQKPDPKVEADMKKAEMEAQGLQQEQQFEMQKMQLELQMAQAEHQMKLEMMQAELALEREKLNLEREKMGMEREKQAMALSAQREKHALDSQARHEAAESKRKELKEGPEEDD